MRKLLDKSVGMLLVCLWLCFTAHAVTAHATGTNAGTCVYTFNVPRDDNSCPPGSVESDVDLKTLKTAMDNQHSQLSEQLKNLTEALAALTQPHNAGNQQAALKSGTHYTRWGRTVCPDSAQVIYSGYMAKSHYSHGGGGNYLCLPIDPEFPSNADGADQSKSYIFGVEYEKLGSPLVPDEKADNDVPCAVCHVNDRGEQMMIPARKTCPEGWTKEYGGVLMAEYHLHKSSSTFVCIDSEMEVVFGGQANDNGGLLYVVEARCGALPCPPYQEGYEVLCCVCTL